MWKYGETFLGHQALKLICTRKPLCDSFKSFFLIAELYFVFAVVFIRIGWPITPTIRSEEFYLTVILCYFVLCIKINTTELSKCVAVSQVLGFIYS